MTRLIKPLLSIAFLLCVTAGLLAQKTQTYTHKNRIFHEAVDLFEKEKYSAAHDKFNEFIKLTPDPFEELGIASEFYAGICSLYLFHKDAEYNLEKFVLDHPDSPWVLKVYFELATYNYKRKKYKKALEWFEYVDPKDVPANQLAEFYFKRGHAYFEKEEYEKAKLDLAQIQDQDTRYQSTALYYYSHIAYLEDNHETALRGFLALQDDPNFAPVVPYYITQLYYKQGRYEQLLIYAPTFLDSSKEVKVKRLPEISRLVGDAYYRENKFEEAIPYLELYHEKTTKNKRTPNDFYQLGFAYYNTGGYVKALEAFNECSEEDSELGQSSLYYMGDCYLKLDQKPYARNAFGEASEMDYNMQLKEDALFNSAKLAYELDFNPFNEAIVAFEKYLEEYPDSPRADEAHEFLLNVYMKSRNYEAALNALDKIENKDDRTKEAYQVVAYNHAVELFQAGSYTKAIEYFDKVSDYPVNQSLIAESEFWKAENHYRLENYQKAYDTYQSFITEPGSFNSEWFEEANYGAGYSLFKQKKYLNATSSFRKYVDNYKSDDPKKLNDSYLRLGDCYYVEKKYTEAIGYYEKAIALNQPMKDYGMFQKAICYGLKEEYDNEIWVLKQLLEGQPDSRYAIDAKFELARTYLADDDLSNASKWYNDLISNHPTSPYRKRSLVDMVLIAVKSGDENKAISLWNEIITDYPNDPIAKDAYPIIEDVLIANDITPPEDIVSSDEHEAKVFEKGASYAYSGNCADAVPTLNSYLEKYQPAQFGIEANYHLGMCYFDQGKNDMALEAFNFVISQPLSDFTEESLVVASTINFNNENYEQAKNLYIELEQVAVLKNNVLEAEIGLMRCHYNLGELDYALEYAEKVIANGSTPDNIKSTAYLWRGKILMDKGQFDDAYYDFDEVLKSGGAKAAEAKYNMALIAYKKEAFKPAEKEIFQLIEKYSSYSEWKYKAFLLLADVYVGLEDLFQAKATLNTILDNVSEPWVIDEARARLEQIEAIENSRGPEGEQEEIEIDLSEEDKRGKSQEDEEEPIDEGSERDDSNNNE